MIILQEREFGRRVRLQFRKVLQIEAGKGVE